MNDTVTPPPRRQPLPPPIPPSSTPPPPPPPPPAAAVATAPRPTPDRSGSRSAAAWLAIAGAGLLFVAAVVVVASRWQQIPQSVRFSGLLATFVLIAALAEQLRRVAPTTATVIAHLVPAFAVTVGVAAGATVGQPWPVCIVIGGLLGAIVTEVEKRRWASPRMAVIAAVGLVLAACGVAAGLDIPAPLVAAGVACVLLLGGRDLEAAVIAIVVGASPVLATLTTVKVGDGTMTRIGAAGADVAWAAPVAGALAALVLGVLAHRRHSASLAGAAAGAFVLNVVAGLAVFGAPPSAWVCVATSMVILIELAAASRARSIWAELATRASAGVAPMVAITGLVAPPIVLAAWSVGLATTLSSWILPLTLCVVSSTIIAARRLRTLPALADLSLADLSLAGAVGFAMAAAAAMGATSLTLSFVAGGCLALCAVRGPLSLCWKAAVAGSVYLALTIVDRALSGMQFGVESPWTLVASIDVALALAGGLLCAIVIGRRHEHLVGRLMTVVGATGLVAALASPGQRPAVAAAAVALVGLVCAWRHPVLAVPVAAMSSVVALLTVDARSWSSVAAVGIAAAVAFAGDRPITSRAGTSGAGLQFAASAQLVVAAWLGLLVAGAPPNGVVGAMIVAAITLTGIAFITPRFTPLDSAALTATVLAALSTTLVGVHPAFVSLVVLLGSAQGIVYSVARQRSSLALGSAVVGTGSVISLWFTSGTNAALLSSLARFDFTAADLTALAIGVTMLIAGIGLRRWQPMSTWLAYGPGLALVSAWIVAVETGRGADWATMAGLAFGILAMAIGGWRRMAAPLVIGTCLLGATVVVASGAQLASLPGWSWLVVGGVVLLGLAILIERHGKDDGDARGELKAMFERFQ